MHRRRGGFLWPLRLLWLLIMMSLCRVLLLSILMPAMRQLAISLLRVGLLLYRNTTTLDSFRMPRLGDIRANARAGRSSLFRRRPVERQRNVMFGEERKRQIQARADRFARLPIELFNCLKSTFWALEAIMP